MRLNLRLLRRLRLTQSADVAGLRAKYKSSSAMVGIFFWNKLMTFRVQWVSSDMKSIFLVLILGISSIIATAQKEVFFSKHSAPDSMNAAFGSFVLNSFGAKLYTEATKGKITLYQDPQFKDKLSPNGINLFFLNDRNTQIINPENPDDPYDLIDTVISEWISPYDWLEIHSTQNHLFIRSAKTYGKFAYIKFGDAKKLLYGDLILASLNVTKAQTYQGDNFGFAVQNYYDELQWSLLESIIDDPINIYENMDCTQPPKTPSSIYDFCITRENYQTINPENPNDPYDLIDTVVTIPANSANILGLDYHMKSDISGSSHLHSLSFQCAYKGPSHWEWNQSLQNHVPLGHSFFIKTSDLEKRIGKEQTRYLMLNYVWTLNQ